MANFDLVGYLEQGLFSLILQIILLGINTPIIKNQETKASRN